MRPIHAKKKSKAVIQNKRMCLAPEGQDSGEINLLFCAFMMFFQDVIIREDNRLGRYYG